MNPYPQLLRACTAATAAPTALIVDHLAAQHLHGTPYGAAAAAAAVLAAAHVLALDPSKPRSATPADKAIIPAHIAFPLIAAVHVAQALAVSMWVGNPAVDGAVIAALLLRRALQHWRTSHSLAADA